MTSRALRIVCCALAVALLGCARTTDDVGGETNWLRCSSDDECGGGQACRSGRCVPEGSTSTGRAEASSDGDPPQPIGGQLITTVPPEVPNSHPMAGTSGGTPHPRTWSDCLAALEQGAQNGDFCSSTADVTGCGKTEPCSADFAICDSNNRLKVSQLQMLDCPASEPPDEAAARVFVGAEDCERALVEGHTFDACEGSFVCAERTDDPCCVDHAICFDDGMLARYHFCLPSCTRVEPDPVREPVTDCSYFAPEAAGDGRAEYFLADLPCEGDFICWNDRDLTRGATVDVMPSVGQLRWCSEGVVQGQHVTISPAHRPSR